jgi:hypothetical protein
MNEQIARCRAEISAVEAQIRAGHPDLQGLCLALADWSAELRLLREIAAAAPQLVRVRPGGGGLAWGQYREWGGSGAKWGSRSVIGQAGKAK